MSRLLWGAAVYNLLWGALVVVAPFALFDWAGMSRPTYPEIWQCVGMIVGVYGVGYAIAATNPYRHWPIVLVGLLGKLFGPLGFLFAAIDGRLPWIAGATLLTNDLPWWIPFVLILHGARRHSLAEEQARQAAAAAARLDWVDRFRANTGASLTELSMQSPLMVVFLRHAGCAFCREALADLAERRAKLAATGVQLALVHMSDERRAARDFSRYGLADVPRISDPSGELYRAFDLERGTLRQLMGLDVVWRGLQAALFQGHGFGGIDGDAARMPGVFLLRNGRIEREFRHRLASDRPEYLNLAEPIAAAR